MKHLNFSLFYYQGTSHSTDKKPHVYIIIIYLYCRKRTRRAFFIIPGIVNLRGVYGNLWWLTEKIRSQVVQFIINFGPIRQDEIISKTMKPKGRIRKLKGIPSMAWRASLIKDTYFRLDISILDTYTDTKYMEENKKYEALYPWIPLRTNIHHQNFGICTKHADIHTHILQGRSIKLHLHYISYRE